MGVYLKRSSKKNKGWRRDRKLKKKILSREQDLRTPRGQGTEVEDCAGARGEGGEGRIF